MAELKRLQVQKNSYIAPTVWDGSPTPMLDMASVIITCTVAPTAPRVIKGGPAADAQLPVDVLLSIGDGSTPKVVNAITVAGDYSPLNGGKWFSLAAGDGTGTFFISGAQS